MTEFTKHILQIQDDKSDLSKKFKDHKPPLHRYNCFYIVSAVLIEDGKVLLVTEAKSKCYGLLCLPAGKVKKDETLEVRRVVCVCCLLCGTA